jgi:hypothetical protein
VIGGDARRMREEVVRGVDRCGFGRVRRWWNCVGNHRQVGWEGFKEGSDMSTGMTGMMSAVRWQQGQLTGKLRRLVRRGLMRTDEVAGVLVVHNGNAARTVRATT